MLTACPLGAPPEGLPDLATIRLRGTYPVLAPRSRWNYAACAWACFMNVRA